MSPRVSSTPADLPESASTPRDVALVLAEIGTLIELNGGNSFRARAFVNAARALEGTDVDLRSLAEEGRLTELKGVGGGLADVISELVLTGRSPLYEELKTATPIGLYDLRRVPGLGNKRIHTLHEELKIDSLEALEQAARAGKVAKLPGFGKKTEQKILEGIEFAQATRGRRRYPDAMQAAARLLGWLRGRKDVAAADAAGSLRRLMEVVDEVVLVAATDKPAAVLGTFVKLQGVTEVVREPDADSASVRLTDGLLAHLRCVPAAAFVGVVAWETGSPTHVERIVARAEERGLGFNPGGLFDGGKIVRLEEERELYERLDLGYVPPELREGLGEVDAAEAGPLPELVATEDLTGTFHCHTTASDGKATLEEMAEASRAKGWSYLGIADHSQAAAYAGGLTPDRVLRQQREIDEWNAANAKGKKAFRLFKGIESDILPDGRLDYDDALLETFDYVVGSVHSGFGMTEAEMTKRVIRAVRHPALTMLGHATGRLLLTRDGYPIDLRAVIEAAAEARTVIEINANPHRLDMDWRQVRFAAELGVLIAVNPDAHSVRELDNVAYGVNMARKAGLEPRQVLNTWSLNEIEKFFATRKQDR